MLRPRRKLRQSLNKSSSGLSYRSCGESLIELSCEQNLIRRNRRNTKTRSEIEQPREKTKNDGVGAESKRRIRSEEARARARKRTRAMRMAMSEEEKKIERERNRQRMARYRKRLAEEKARKEQSLREVLQNLGIESDVIEDKVHEMLDKSKEIYPMDEMMGKFTARKNHPVKDTSVESGSFEEEPCSSCHLNGTIAPFLLLNFKSGNFVPIRFQNVLHSFFFIFFGGTSVFEKSL
ncbi:hypothetical protein AB6A40_010422 [Gnathostoma spinigerum]|uniref:BZIP domain-containing protein n=1 Tax=Gnathostoma spinigerum TaxID=75299 RepID=A0ABD6F1P9_9BILA